VVLQAETLHRLVRDPLTSLIIGAASQLGFDRQPRAGRCAADGAHGRREAAQGFARPVQADGAEEPVLDRVPLRAAARVMEDGHRQTFFIAPDSRESG
jgi:hypothetical protein